MPRTSPTDEEKAKIREVYGRTRNVTKTAEAVGMCRQTVRKYLTQERDSGDTFQGYVARDNITPLPEPAIISNGCPLPEPSPDTYEDFDATTVGHTLIINDTHIPHHDVRTINKAVAEGRKVGVKCVLLNGDILDGGKISNHNPMPDEDDLVEELDKTEKFIDHLRGAFPKARIIFREGNHEFRLPRYIARNAPELFSLKQLKIQHLLNLAKYGVEWVDAGRVITLGKLYTVHGHEFRGSGGVAPARWLWLKANASTLCGHLHRTNDYMDRGIDRREYGCWTVGCATFLWPAWLRQNKWNHGWALVEVFNNNHFQVTNRRVLLNGDVV